MNAKHLRRIVSVALICVLLFGGSIPFCPLCVPILTAQAATTESGFQYIADSTTKTSQITGYSGSALAVSIPATAGGYSVTSIKSEAFKNHGSLLSVTIPDSVTLIGSEAFANCLMLSTVKLGKGLVTIGAKAFMNCPMITSLSIPSLTSSIGALAFYGCKALSDFSVDSGNLVYTTKDGALTDRLGTTLYFYPPARSDKTYTVPSVVTVDEYAFANAKRLTSVVLPESVITLGKGAFENCTALEQVVLSSKLKKIDEGVFSGCTKLNAVSFPTTITSIGKDAFKGCTSIPALTVPDSVTSISDGAFSGCTGIKTVTIGKGMSSASGAIFSGCYGITEYKIADGAQFSVQEGVLFSKDGTQLIAYPAGSKATSYTVGDKVTKIGANAFDSCKNLQKLTIPKNVKTFTKPVIRNCSGTTIYVESGSEAETFFRTNTDGYASLKIGTSTPGDVNGSGSVDNADVILLRRYVAGWKNVTIQTDAGDVNKDSKVDNADVILLRRYVAGWKNVTLK